jgi:peptidoglycan DL-endopeptidase CwlO
MPAVRWSRPNGPTVSGIGVLFVLGGLVLVTSGIKNTTVAETLRAWVRGKPAPEGPGGTPFGVSTSEFGGAVPGTRPGFSTGIGDVVAATAKSYAGVPYVWAGEVPPPNGKGWDCSGFVTWCLAHENGIDLPNNHHTTAAGFYFWRGARTIPRAACAPGDLVCWVSHVGIAVSRDRMMHAPGVGKVTQESAIGAGATIRRPIAYGS